MSSRIWASFLFAVVVFTFADVTNAASTTTPIENATVNLYCLIKANGVTYSATGSGVFIHESGIILTNAHVAQYFLLSNDSGRAKTRCHVRDGSPAKEHYEVSLMYLSPNWAKATVEATAAKQPRKGTGEWDFALLRVTEAKKGQLPERFPALPLNFGVPLFINGEEVTAGGYPAEGLGFRAIQKKLARVTATSTIDRVQSFERPFQDMLALTPSRAAASGVSGGPVVDAADRLMGIIVTLQEGNVPKDDRSLRAITLAYIDRMFRTETGYSLAGFIADPSRIGVDVSAAPFSDLLETIKKTLRNTR